MLMEIKKYLNLIKLYLLFNFASSMEYRASFITQIISIIINNSITILFWLILFDRFEIIAGYSKQDMMFVWALASSAFGLAFIVFGNIGKISSFVLDGDLDSYLLQPKDVYLNVILSRSSLASWGDLIFGYGLFITFCGFTLERLLFFTILTVLGAVLVTSIVSIIQTLAFFIGNASTIGEFMFEILATLSIYPESIYKGWIRAVLYSVLPVGYIIFMPLRIYKYFNWGSTSILLIIDLLYVLFSYYFFKFGLKRYESGNLITTKS